MIHILREQVPDRPDDGPLTMVAPPISITVAVSPMLAQRRATGYLAREVAMTLLAHNPLLLVGEPVVWRFDVDWSLPNFGRVATMGEIDVDILRLSRTLTLVAYWRGGRCTF